MKQLSALDASFLALDTDTNYGHVGSVAILDPSTSPTGTKTVDDVRRLLGERLHMVPPFRCRLAPVPFGLDWPYWVEDEHFDLGYHVREIALPPPGSMDQLREQVGRIYSRRLDRSRPLWELYIIHGLPDGRVAMLSKIHHAAVDGMSGGEIMSMLYDVSPEEREIERPEEAEPDSAPAGREMIVKGIGALPRYPFTVVNRLARLAPHIDVLPSIVGMRGAERISRNMSRVRNAISRDESAQVIERPAHRPPKGVYDQPVSPHRIFGLGSISLGRVKEVKGHFGVKVNDVIVSLVAGAVREHLISLGQLPDAPLITQVPVSVRTEEELGTFGNQVSIMLVELPTHLEEPAARLAFAADRLSSAKDRHKALPAKALRDVTQFVPPALHARAARVVAEMSSRRWVRPPYNIVISNVPGPPIDIYSGGARLEALYPLSIITDGAGLNFTVMSYRDSIDIGITADREQTPDVQSMVDGMRRELDALAEIAGVAVAS